MTTASVHSDGPNAVASSSAPKWHRFGEVWPQVLGATSIFLGMTSAVRLLGQFLLNLYLVREFMQGPMRDQIQQESLGQIIWKTLYSLLPVLGYLLLIIAGLQLWRMRVLGRKLHVASAIALLGLGSVELEMRPGPELAMTIAAIPFAAAYPVFLLVWLLRPRVAREVHVWREQPPSRAPLAAIWPQVVGAVLIAFAVIEAGTAMVNSAWYAAYFVRRFLSSGASQVSRIMVGNVISLAWSSLTIAAGVLLYRRNRCAAFVTVMAAVVVVGEMTIGAYLLYRWITPHEAGVFTISGALSDGVWLLLNAFLVYWFCRPQTWRQLKAWRQSVTADESAG